MKTLRILFAASLAFFALWACDDDDSPEPTPNQGEYDEAWYAENATISSDTVLFGAEGGEAVVTVDCGTEWVAENSSSDFDVTYDAGTVTIVAGQNTVAEEKTAEITLMTAESGIEFAVITVTQEAYSGPTISVEVNEWNVPAKGNLMTEIAVYATDEWDVEAVNCDWLTVDKTETGISLTASENVETEERTTEVVVTCTDGVTSDSQTIEVTQDALAYMNVSAESLHFDGAESYAITVESNFDWTAVSSANWITVNSDVVSGTLTLTSAATTEEDERDGTITLTAGDGVENVVEAKISATQTGCATLVIVLDVPEPDYVPIPLTSWVDCEIDWGDGEDPEYCSWELPDHYYEAAGEYRVRVTGTWQGIDTREWRDDYYKGMIKGIKQWGTSEMYTFCLSGATNLEYIATDAAGSFIYVESFESAFNGCTSLKEIPAGMFDYAESSWDFTSAFEGCTSLTSIPAGLFDSCLDASFTNCFDGCSSLKEIPARLFAGAGGNFFSYVFRGTAITSVPEDLFSGCRMIRDIQGLFSGCSKLTSVPVNLFDDCTYLSYLNETFYNCTALTGESPYTEKDGVKVHLYERSSDNGYGNYTPSTYSNCFTGCTNLDDYDQIPDTWK